MRFRTWMKKTRAGHLVWRLFIGIIGGGVTVLGAVALVGPGPGVLVVLAGLGILATEFAWAGEAMMHTKRIANKAADRAGLPKWASYFLISAGAVVSIIAVLIYYSR
ncbi:MAG: hypothetical protein D4S00_06290 [Streptomycetaceae bacterium]|nr:MAG: hypothetical protein D4S00_06290 [Streptomycetaceae bacterium]